jgi:DNA-binding response OmpR family regulator
MGENEHATSAVATAIKSAEAPENGTIVVAEDDPAQRKLLRTILTKHGYTVVEAADGHEAIERVRTAHPDLVLLDWELPLMSGCEVTSVLKGAPETLDIPIVILTGRSHVDDKVEALELGAQDFITKPYDTREFIARIGQQIRWRHLLDARGAPKATLPVIPKTAAVEPTPGLDRLRAELASGVGDTVLRQAMEIAERCEERKAYEDAAQAYALASEAADAVKTPDFANKLQRLAGKMYLLLAEHATDPVSIQRAYAMSAKMFLTAGNLKLSNEVAQRQR